MVDFGSENDSRQAQLGEHDVCVKERFPDLGHMHNSDTCSKSYVRFGATCAKPCHVSLPRHVSVPMPCHVSSTLSHVKHLVTCQLLCYAKCQLLAASCFYVSVPCQLPRVSCLPPHAATWYSLVSPKATCQLLATLCCHVSASCQPYALCQTFVNCYAISFSHMSKFLNGQVIIHELVEFL